MSNKDVFEENNNYSRYYFIDYENVNRGGLNGVAKLNEDDCVRIYYSSSAETLTFGLHRRLNESRAQFKYFKIDVPIKNAIDCQIVFDIRDISKEHKKSEFIIVSKDSDYDKAIEYFRNSHNLKLKKVTEICFREELKENSSTVIENDKWESQVRSYYGQHFKKQIYKDNKEKTIQVVLNAKSKSQVKKEILNIYESEKVANEVNKKLQQLIKNLPE